MFKVKAIVHSLKDLDTVTILSENGPNDVTADYNGQKCTAIYNVFNGLYYVDDIYGLIDDSSGGPSKDASDEPRPSV